MFQRIRRYLAFLIVFALSTISLTDLGIVVEDGILEAAHIEQEQSGLESADAASLGKDLEQKVEPSNFSACERLEPQQEDQENKEPADCNCEWSVCEEANTERQAETEDFFNTSLEFVSVYVHKYQKLPPVYRTKKEASQLGWIGGGLGAVSDKVSIGGDYFGNYQGLLPQKAGRSYHECDIDALGTDSRGTKRLVYSNDGLMYYTEDHYETFQLLYSHWDNENL